MQFVRRHRRVVLLIFGLMALAGMTYGALKRVGIDPLEALRPEAAEEP